MATAALGASVPLGCGGTSNADSPSTSGSSSTASIGASPRREVTASVGKRHAAVPERPPAGRVQQPRIVWDPIPFRAKRKAEMVAYVQRHYGVFLKPTWRLIDPHVIVIHYTDGSTFQSAWNTFADDVPDAELHELPATCAHFVIDTNGTIYQLVSLGTMCRHVVGLNWTAIGIEHVGESDGQVLGNPMMMSSSLRLVRWLRCRFHIPLADVIGHNESLSSPYHHEDAPSLRAQTHSDFNRPDMDVYRSRLSQLGGCPG